ncbi:MAG: exodeoxyribonuclease VII large subunit [Acidobacteria bacterium]|nr:MAG: exodeoxyribonuclease VII large subunit [Acidobacteriota bacterium]PYQ65363.1 MAG: exodeoxyribonuclease VII large subunit [Acidobacteriota bacterium]
MYPRPVPAAAPPRPYTVSELLAEVGGSLRASWRDVAVTGEIGRWEVRGGHGYFTLKDRTGCLNAIIFASDRERIPFRVEPGLEVVARGSLDLWPPQGKFQLKTYQIEPVGAGALQLAFEQLKALLAAEGLFDASRKRRIPLFPRSIGLVTSPEGAAIRDIVNVLRRRHDGLAITIYPARVQGVGAAAEIAEGIRAFNRRGGFDVLIVTRGGGSPEDLAPFNDERVARALAASRIPTISAVGHETDVSIADLAADLRAATPSAAAELVVERKEELCRRAEGWRVRVERAIRSRLALAGARVSGEKRAEGLLRFRYRLRERRERVAQDLGALKSALERRPARLAARLESARRALAAFPRMAELSRKADAVANRRRQLEDRMGFSLAQRTGQLRDCGEKLGLVNPFAILARGYAVAYREGTKFPLLSAESVRPGERIRVRLHEGELRAIVRGVPVPRPARPADGDFGPLFSDATEDNP